MSEGKAVITTELLQRQVAEYARLLPDYDRYASALRRVLEKACKSAFPEAFVQARPKSVTSFAEKAVRKFAKYPDAVSQMTDLCGARVIVQTLEQVRAVRQFIEAGFTVLEADEKGLSLGEDKFGYRDMHYLVRLAPERAAALGFTPEEVAAIGDKTAEIQVRTWVQHAWADTLHDRIYKTKLKYPAEFKRAGALLAAIMEDGDRAFGRLAGDIDAMLANFSAYASREEVARELAVQELILGIAEPAKRPEIALRIARLAAPGGDYARVAAELAPHAEVPSPLGCAIRLELGHALCRLHRGAPGSEPYRRGQALLQRVVERCRGDATDAVADLRRRASTLARALARLAWSYEAVDADAHKARDCYREALELEPGNPYYLADVLGHEINWSRRRDFIGAMAADLRRAIVTCREHVRNGTEMPYAAFTAGRLHLLLGEADEALGAYARGIAHVLECGTCAPPDVLGAEERWLILVTKPDPLSGGTRWAMDLLGLAGQVRRAGAGRGTGTMATPVLIVGGGAGSLAQGQVAGLRPMLDAALAGFAGTVISGGTRVGVPGCVGDAAAAIGPRGGRPFRLVGYLPRVRPGDAPKDERYDDWIESGESSFTAEQILRNWADILAAGVTPGEVRFLGFGGGPLSAVEYRIALGLGACVGLVSGSGGAADALLKDDLWAGAGGLLALPADPASVRALAHPPRGRFHADDGRNDELVEAMARAFHEEYVKSSSGRLPANMKPWPKLGATFRKANTEQARYSVQILEACGFAVRPAADPAHPAVFSGFTEGPGGEVERMAEMEHGRWNVERLRDGWRPGKPRDDAARIHDCLVPWSELPEDIRHYDRDAVRQFPAILAKAGLEVSRRAEA